MSGTSMDGVDAVLVDFKSKKPYIIATHTQKIPSQLLTNLHLLADPETSDINLLGESDKLCGELFATSVNNLLHKTNISPKQIIAIGSHGQTVRHMPNSRHPFSMQIGDACTIAVKTGIDTIADFRRKDIALGGQGAPLVPAFHQTVFSDACRDRIILNIGGISNITYLSHEDHDTYGFDTGPGNTLLDLWYQKHHSDNYDNEGSWAATGKVYQPLLTAMLAHSYFAQSAPKSTGRELFNISWLNQHIKDLPHLAPQDIQATLSQLTAQSIADEIKKQSSSIDIFICGGGVFNKDLICRLQKLLPTANISSTIELGVDPQWVEGVAFAWLAYCFVNNKTSNLPEVTGAEKAAILGSFYPSN